MEHKSVNSTSFTSYTCAPLHQGNLLVKPSKFAKNCDMLLLSMICNAGYPIDLPTASEGSTALPSFITVAPVFHAIIIANLSSRSTFDARSFPLRTLLREISGFEG